MHKLQLSKIYPFSSNYSTWKKVKDLEYQYLQKSRLPTMHFQPSLPRLPVPELTKTGERYLNALRPLLSGPEYAEALGRTDNFIKNEGKKSQEKLKIKDKINKHTSYISDYWFDLYLRDRVPLPINYNPHIVMQNDIKSGYNDQLVRAANVVVSSVRFMLSLRASILEPEIFHMNPKKSNTELFRTLTGLLPSSLSWYGAYAFKAFPLDMSQFVGLFGATRIAKNGKDQIFRDPVSKHLLIQRHGHFYVFDVLDSDGNLLSPDKILAHLKYIMEDDRPPAEYPVGVLTTQDRNVWASQRQHLEATGNKAVLNVVDSAIFNLVLDDKKLHDNKCDILLTYLHGDGENRWFDKSFSLIVSKDGVAGVNFEHSWGDGVAVLRYFQDVYAEITNKPFVHPETKPANCNVAVKKLDFNLDEKSKLDIINANKSYKKWCDSLSIDYTLYEKLNKDACKKLKVSPDFIMQLGFQSAFYLLRGGFVGTYESCSTSAFKHGRTETMRPCTVLTQELCQKLNSGSPSKDELRTLMQKCSAQHSQLVKEAAMGQGFDRHLFALKKIAEENDIKVADFFDSHEYKLLNKSILSTSTLSSPSVMAGGFGPVVREGFGIAYSAFPDKLGASVSSYKEHNNSTDFVRALDVSFESITRFLSG